MGMKCPKCGSNTFFPTPTGRNCTKCGFKMVVPPRPTQTSGPGKRCSNCGKMQVFNGKCRNCGATFLD